MILNNEFGIKNWNWFYAISALFLLLLLFFLNQNRRNFSKQKKEIEKEKKLLEEKKLKIEKQTSIFSDQIESNLKKEKKINDLLENAKENLYKISGIESEEARKIVLENAKKGISDELNYIASLQIKETKKKINKKVTEIICSSFERYTSKIVFSKTVDSVSVSNETASRIIGKDGRNINSFRRITGTEIIVGKGKKFSLNSKNVNSSDRITVEISCFDSLRREIAIQTLKKLVENEKKITPLYIEKAFEEITSIIEETIFQTAENVLDDLKIENVSEDIMKFLGRLKYRTSYGQNVLEHSIEVSRISGTIAAELGLDPSIAKRAGLFHDIGKSTEDFVGLSHVTSGILIAKKNGESEIVINAIASHHDRSLADNPYSLIVSAADTLSAARPGARSNQVESYITRMKDLEKIGSSFEGIKKMYSFQAGREIWVIVDSNKVSDFQCIEILKDVRIMIQETVVIPGDVTISLIREKKVVDKIVNSGRNFKK